MYVTLQDCEQEPEDLCKEQSLPAPQPVTINSPDVLEGLYNRLAAVARNPYVYNYSLVPQASSSQFSLVPVASSSQFSLVPVASAPPSFCMWCNIEKLGDRTRLP